MAKRFLTPVTVTVSTGTAPFIVSSTTVVTNLNADLLDGQNGSYYSPISSPALTGIPTAPTASSATNTTQIATTAYVKSQGYSTTTGTVTSVNMSTPTGLSISGNPVTSSGTLALSLTAGYEIPQSSAIVHIAGTETITGAKTFSSNVTINGVIYGQNSSGSGDVLQVGNDSKISDINVANTLGIIGISNSNTGYIRFGSGGTFGYNGTILTANKDLSITGALTATTKSFDIEHPTKENMRLRYGSLEGPENGVYVRGKSSSSTITLPDYWTGLVDPDSITVQVTSIGKHKNLYVKDISDNTVTIGGVRGEFEFFYFIQAERIDVDKLVVEYGS
jgi:hypothetical protein